MHQFLNGVPTDGILAPGEVYIFTECESRACHIDPLHFSYVIKSEREVLPALEVELTSLEDYYDFKDYTGCKRISDDCYVFRFQCLEKPDMKKKVYALYLHRMMSLQDVLNGRRLEDLGR